MIFPSEDEQSRSDELGKQYMLELFERIDAENLIPTVSAGVTNTLVDRAVLQYLMASSPTFEQDLPKKKLLFVLPESLGDIILALSLVESATKQYPDYLIYFATNDEHKMILEDNPFVHMWLPYANIMEVFPWLEGCSRTEKIFDIVFCPFFLTQRNVSYIHNGLSNIAYNLKDE
jgi:hypothetical protein